MKWDYWVTAWINSFSSTNHFVDLIFIGITLAGPALMVACIASRWWPRRNGLSDRHLAIRCGLATALGLTLNQVILLFYQRQRPYVSGLSHLIISKTTDPSFPSDHATVGAAIAMMLLILKDKWRHAFVLFFFIVCISRVYVGTHYVTDVMGGALTGALAAFAVFRGYDKLRPVTTRLVTLL